MRIAKKLIAAALVCTLTLTGCGVSVDSGDEDYPVKVTNNYKAGENGEVYVFNWGEYIDERVIDSFEKETGIKVIYNEFEENEDMYPIIASGAQKYDVVCPSDFMVEKMIGEGMLEPLDKDKIPNLSNIGASYLEAAEEFDPGNLYCVPYTWGTIGIIYNTKMIDEPITSWASIFDEKYKGNLLMLDSVRAAFMSALVYLGYSENSKNEDEIKAAADLLSSQHDIVQAYVVDQLRDKMISGEASIGVTYSGEVLYMTRQNPDLAYVVPDEGSAIWMDGWVIPKNCNNKENAEAWIDFMCRADVALANFNYITYSTPNTAAQALIDDDTKNNEAIFPSDDVLKRCEILQYLGQETEDEYMNLWSSVKAE